MSSIDQLKARNQEFADNFTQGDLVPLPKFGMIIIACADARVDPTNVLGLELGDAVVMRNNGGRVTPAIIDELPVKRGSIMGHRNGCDIAQL